MSARGRIIETATMQGRPPLMNRFERRLRRRNLAVGEASEGAAEAPSE
jgi:hypothetical protein